MVATSEARVVVSNYQRAEPKQLNATNELITATIDNLTRNFMSGRSCYGGMSVAPDVSNYRAVVAPGTLYAGGPGYALQSSFVIDLADACNAVPDDNFALVAVLANGFEDPEAEKALATALDPSKKPARPGIDPWPLIDTTLPTRKVRYVEISHRVSAPDVNPDLPSFGSNLCLIAILKINKTGVVSTAQNKGTQIYSLDQVGLDTQSLTLWRTLIEPQIASLISAIAALALQISGLNYDEDIARLQQQINDLASRVQAGLAVLRGADYYVDESGSAKTDPSYNAVIREGLRFPSGFVDEPIEPQNRYASNVRVVNDKLLPYWEGIRTAASPAFTVGSKGGTTLKPSDFRTVEASGKVRGFAALRARWGRQFLPQSTSQVLAAGDPNLLFGLLPSDVNYDAAVWGDWRTGSTELFRRNGFWSDLASRGPWSRVLAQVILSGQPGIDQPYRAPGAEMVTSITVPLEKAAGLGNLRVIVAGDAGGNIDLGNIFADVTVANADLGATATIVAMPYPILKQAGQTLHFLMIVQGAHRVRALSSTGDGGAIAGALNGKPRCYVNGQWSEIAAVKEIALVINRASFGDVGTARIPCQPLTLAGGIDALDLLAPAIIPPGCSVSFEVTIGGMQVPIAEVDGVHPLTGGAASLPLTLVMTYTEAVAPMIDISGLATGAKARVAKSGTALRHISATRSPAVAVTKVTHVETVDAWDAVNQTLIARLQTGPGFATETPPTRITDEATGSTLRRSFEWTGLSGVTAHRIALVGTATAPNTTFVGRSAQFSADA